MTRPDNNEQVTVDFLAFRRLKNAIDEMQGRVFYCEDDDGVLCRWTPPRPYKEPKT